ncbi:MAG: HAD-IIIA family hydrolase [Alphaproteobacteria bacterium]|nr:MAG: HAD-IIIA family hydrolase [Alphaproteobacteria bacterium]
MLVLLDRDGVINEDRADFVKSPAELVLIPGAAEAIAELCGHGHRIAIVTNQSCIGRGLIGEEQLDAIHAKLHNAVRRAGGRIEDIIVAPDAPWAATERRKPGPGMLLEAMQKFKTAARESVLVGDSLRDLQAAKAANCHRILVQTGKGRATQAAGIGAELLPVHVAKDLAAACGFILEGRF